MMAGQVKNRSAQEALEKAQKFCAYQERCFQDVRKKLFQWHVDAGEHDQILQQLEKENFISNDRYTALFVRSKINQNRWGRQKIKTALLGKMIPETLIDKHLQKIDNEKYLNNLKTLKKKKLNELTEKDPYKREIKLKNYLFGKGYEPELINEIVKTK